MRAFSSAILLLVALLLAAGCEHADPLEADPNDATLTSVQATVFNTSCAVSGCHLGGTSPFGLDLSDGQAFGTLVGVASREVPGLLRVEAGNATDSYLFIKISGGSRIASGTARMPLGRAPLSDEQIDLVRRWIDAGARDD